MINTAFLESILILAGSLVLMFLSSEVVVDKAVDIAKILKRSHFAIGAILVGATTSFPETIVSSIAAAQSNAGIAIGNVIGSNIADIALLLFIGVFFGAIAVKKKWVMKNSFSLFAITVLPLALLAVGTLNALCGILLIGFFVCYCIVVLRQTEEHKDKERPVRHKVRVFLYFFAAVAVLVAASKFTVESASDIAATIGVSQAFIGLTIVAVGTSLPELGVTISSARKKHPELLLGNIIGSCAYNISFILGLSAIINPSLLSMAPFALSNIFLIGTCLFLWYVLLAHKGVKKMDGIIFGIAYFAYILVQSRLI